MKSWVCLVLSYLLSVICIYAQSTTVNYQYSDEDFANPERGFYRYSETRASNYSVLDSAYLASLRELHQPGGDPSFQVYSSLVFRYYILDDFVNSAIDASFLANMQVDFDEARKAGMKLIPRFCYTNVPSTGNCGSWICPPYGDASKARVLQHIGELAPVIRANKDVIACMQMGFIGTWGEQYYTDFFGDASMSPYKLFDNNWNDRNEVLQMMLDSLPDDRMIQVRYPQLKQRLIYGVSAPTSSPTMTQAQAYSKTDIARLGFHNDCYLASYTDFGTYNDYGNTATPSGADTTNLKPYQAADTKYTVMGGETCSGNNPFDNCSGTDADARADSEMKRMHFSYLNAEFNYADVNSDWVGTCMEDIKRELGYRLHMLSATIDDEVVAGETIQFAFNIENKGYAAPFNRRGLKLVLQHQATGESYFAELEADPRYWFRESGSIQVTTTVCVPVYTNAGEYDAYLYLPDPEPTLFERPEYAIRLATEFADGTPLWQSETGYHDLGLSLTVSAVEEEACISDMPALTKCKNVSRSHTVTSLNENDALGIRTLIETASCGDTIYFHPSLDADLIITTSPIMLDKDLVIIGNGQGETLLSGDNGHRYFEVTSGAHVHINNCTFQDSSEPVNGGAIYNHGVLLMKAVELKQNFEGASPKGLTNEGLIYLQTGDTIIRM